MENILLIENDQNIALELKKLLELKNYNISILEELNYNIENIDLIIIDININDENKIKNYLEIKNNLNIEVIFLTSKDCVSNKFLENENTIKKPFNPIILFEKIEIMIRKNIKEEVVNYKGLILDLKIDDIKYKNKKTKLTKSEKLILDYLIKNNSSIVSREELLNYLLENEMIIDENAVSLHISRIKKKLSDIGLEDFINTRKNEGYSIN